MDELLIYQDRCLTCGGGDRMFKLLNFCKKNSIKVTAKRVYMFPELEQEASIFAEPMPFIAYKGKTLNYYKVNSNLLDGNPELEELIN